MGVHTHEPLARAEYQVRAGGELLAPVAGIGLVDVLGGGVSYLRSRTIPALSRGRRPHHSPVLSCRPFNDRVEPGDDRPGVRAAQPAQLVIGWFGQQLCRTGRLADSDAILNPRFRIRPTASVVVENLSSGPRHRDVAVYAPEGHDSSKSSPGTMVAHSLTSSPRPATAQTREGAWARRSSRAEMSHILITPSASAAASQV